MALNTNKNRKDHVGNGATTVFTYDFLVFDATDLDVYVNGVLQASGYTVSGLNQPGGGEVTFAVAPANLAAIALVRVVDETQPTQYPVGNKFPSATHERVVDRLTMMVQQLREVLNRALTFGATSSLTGKTVDDLVPGKTLRVKGDGSGIEMVDATSGGALTLPLAVVDGGTGRNTLTSGAYVKGNGAGQVSLQSPPIPVTDGGTGSITTEANLATLGIAGARLTAHQNL